MNTPSRLGDRYTLDPVAPGLKFQSGIGSLALYDKAYLLYTAQLSFTNIGYLQLPTLGLGVHAVHAEQIRSKKHTFFSANAAPNLHNDIFTVIGVLGQQQYFNLLTKLLPLCFGLGVFLLGKLLHFRISHELHSLFHGRPSLFICGIGLHNWSKFPDLTFISGIG